MNEQTFEKQAAIMKTIAHPTRLQIMHLLTGRGETSVAVIHRALGLEQSLTSHHLILMADRGVLVARRQGKQIFYSLTDLVSLTHGVTSFTLTLWPKTDA